MRKKNSISVLLFLTAFTLFLGCSSRLHRAINRGDLSRVNTLLENGANPNNYVKWYGFPLSFAVSRCDLKIIDSFLNHGARIDNTAAELSLRTAVDVCEYSVVNLLLENDIDPNSNHYLGGTILMKGVKRGDLPIVQLLLKYGANPNLSGKYEGWVKPDPGETTALMLASKIGRIDLVRELLEWNADPAVVDIFGYTALKIANETGNQKVAELIEGWAN